MLLLQSNPIAESEWVFPVFEIIHIIGFAAAIGTIAIVDLRMLGLALRRQTAAQLLKDTSMVTLIGLAAVLTSGPILFISDPGMYMRNPSFRFKIGALGFAILYNYTVHRYVARSESPGAFAPLVAVVSLALWLSVVAGGLFIAFV